MELVFFDDQATFGLHPLTLSRPAASLRVGIDTIAEKWRNYLNMDGKNYLPLMPYLSVLYPQNYKGTALLINGRVLPDDVLVKAVLSLTVNQALVDEEGTVLASLQNATNFNEDIGQRIIYKQVLRQLKRPYDLFSLNDCAIKADFERITTNQKSAPIPSGVILIGEESKVFIHPTAKILPCMLNTQSGPIYIGPHAEIMEGSTIRGPFALCEHALVKMATKIYGATTVGPYSKVAGELSNVVIAGYSNKAHDGFLGNAVLGEWCNLGADTNCSNLKNNYGEVKVFHYQAGKQVTSGLQFCGLIMADHSKCGINTMFNTGTVVGVGANIFGGGFPPTFIPSFSWGGADGFETYRVEKCIEVATQVYNRRGLVFDANHQKLLQDIFAWTDQFRNFKK